MICRECVYNLDLFFTFREKTLQTESLLLDLVKKLNRAGSIEKTKDIKLIDEPAPASMDIVTTMADQQLNMVANHQQLLDHTNMSLSHRENMMVNQDEIILNNMHQHEFEHIDIAPNELNSHAMSHDTLHNQQLNMHHDSAMAQLVQQDMQISETQLSVQNLDLIHSQHNLISDYGTMQDKPVESTPKIQREFVTVKVIVTGIRSTILKSY